MNTSRVGKFSVSVALRLLGVLAVVVAPALSACGPTSDSSDASDDANAGLSGGTFGTNTPGTAVDTASANLKEVSQYTAISGSVTKLSGYVSGLGKTSGTQNMKAVLYADSGGSPGALLGVSTQVTVTAGQAWNWVDFPLAAPVAVSAGPIWMGYLASGTSDLTELSYNPTSGGLRYNANAGGYAAGPSNPFGVTHVSDKHYALYATLAGGAPPSTTFGTTTVGTAVDTASANLKETSKYTAIAGSVTKLTGYISGLGKASGNQNLKAIVYADGGGSPGALLGVSSQVTVTAGQTWGWVDFPMPTPVSVSAGTVWMGYIASDASDLTQLSYTPSTGELHYNANAGGYAAGPSNPFGGATLSSMHYALYATLSAPSSSAPPSNTALPVIAGAAQVGQTLSSSTGTWTNAPTSYAYQWQRCDSQGASCAAIGGATSAAWTLAAADPGHTLRVSVTATNGAGSGTAQSAATAVVTAGMMGSGGVAVANLWISPTGDDATCSRSASAVAPTKPCASFDHAVEIASSGDTIGVMPGTFPSRVDNYGYSTNIIHAGPVTFACLQGSAVDSVSFADSGFLFGPGAHDITFSGSCFHFHIAVVGLRGYPGPGNRVYNVTLDGVHMDAFDITGVHDVTVKNSQIGPIDACWGVGTGHGAAECDPSNPTEAFWATVPDGTLDKQDEPFVHNNGSDVALNVTFLHDHFTGMQTKDPGTFHQGGLLVWGTNGLTLDGNVFDHNAIYNVEFNAGTDESNGVFQNNVFGKAVYTLADGANAALPLPDQVCQDGMSDPTNTSTFTNELWRYNTFAQCFDMALSGASGTFTNVRMVGNLVGNYANCESHSGVTYQGNVGGHGGSCGGGPSIAGDPFANSAGGDFHLAGAAGSTAADDEVTFSGDGALAVDITGAARPAAGSTKATAGAYER